MSTVAIPPNRLAEEAKLRIDRIFPNETRYARIPQYGQGQSIDAARRARRIMARKS
jgi:hypothetical protein